MVGLPRRRRPDTGSDDDVAQLRDRAWLALRGDGLVLRAAICSRKTFEVVWALTPGESGKDRALPRRLPPTWIDGPVLRVALGRRRLRGVGWIRLVGPVRGRRSRTTAGNTPSFEPRRETGPTDRCVVGRPAQGGTSSSRPRPAERGRPRRLPGAPRLGSEARATFRATTRLIPATGRAKALSKADGFPLRARAACGGHSDSEIHRDAARGRSDDRFRMALKHGRLSDSPSQ